MKLRGSLPSPTLAFDQARALGDLLMARHHLDRCHITVNANRRRVLSWRLGRPSPDLSVHWALLPFPGRVLDVIARRPGAWASLRKELPTSPLPADLVAKGTVHDLQAQFEDQQRHVPGVPALEVTWGRWPRSPPHRSLRLGSCEPPLIRIHPVLDHDSVPAWFVGFVMFHEMLHAVHLPEVRGERRILHTRAFRRAEAGHPDFGRAQSWERVHVSRLLARCRAAIGGRP